MSVAFTYIYGNEISVSHDTRKPVRQYRGFAGSHGVTAMHLGSRGYPILVTGQVRVANLSTYDLTRAAMETGIYAIEQYNWLGTNTYTFRGSTFNYVVCDDAFEPIPDSHGRMFRVVPGYLLCLFRARFRGLV